MKTIKIFLSIILVGFTFVTCKKDKATPMPTVTDIDGNVYHTVKIGTQTWMVENLKTTQYRNGDAVANLTDAAQWINTVSGAYVDNPNTPDYAKTYGHLYNWFAVNDARNIAPLGWHVPSVAEWTTLTNFLGGENVASDKLREAGTTHWDSPNTGATNSSGFTALPGGYRGIGGGFAMPGFGGSYWTHDQYDSLDGFQQDLATSDPAVYYVNYTKKGGFSVRCIKD